ncbi:glycosyltransferase family 2 protein [Microbacterium sp. NPDC058062]|uniref:glycosyltransferase family 2 protein n=1 Tax=Microbacterium sp. NPDC058062 TaxID=3346320 RepID=UPI0036D8199C
MSEGLTGDTSFALSVVIPSFNSARWLPSTLDALAAAVREAQIAVEVVVVDDGSTDDTLAVLQAATVGFPGPIVVVSQENSGRFLARWAGLRRARSATVFLLDSRVLVAPDALRHYARASEADPSQRAWNGYVVTDPASPLVGLFWEVPTHVFWGGFLRSPRPFQLTQETFDSAPKGTGMFIARKEDLEAAFLASWPEGDARFVSDDTKILRHIAASSSIRLDPGIAATYRPRTTLRGFVRHSFDRGTLFVDSYAGTSVLRSTVLLLLAVLPVGAVAALIVLVAVGMSALALAVAILLVVAALVPVAVAAFNRCPRRGLLAFVVCLPVFVAPFWLGLVRGVFIHRRAFLRPRKEEFA